MIGEAGQGSNVTAQLVSTAALIVTTVVGATFARRAQRSSARAENKTDVPSDNGGRTRDPGPVLAELERTAHGALNASEANTRRLDRIGSDLDKMQRSMARHDGRHEGLERDVRRLLDRVYGDKGKGR